jgi:hypothetical protein
MRVLILLACLTVALASITSCPAGDECVGCLTGKTYICCTVPPGNHDLGLDDDAATIAAGYKGMTTKNTLSYHVNFHPNTLTFPCDTWCSNQNKVMGISRGLVQMTDQS